jgi:hypothetical protein
LPKQYCDPGQIHEIAEMSPEHHSENTILSILAKPKTNMRRMIAVIAL